MKESFAVVASLLAVIGNVSYLRDAFTGKVSPHPYTWFVWTIVSLVTFFGQLQKGAGIGALPTGVAEGFTVLVFLASLWRYAADRRGRKGGTGETGKIRRIDTYFLVAALLGLIPWALTKDPTVSVAVVVAIDVIAFVPTLRKAWARPDTERPLLFQMNVARHALALFSLEAYNVATTLHSVAMICTNSAMAALLRRSRERPLTGSGSSRFAE